MKKLFLTLFLFAALTIPVTAFSAGMSATGIVTPCSDNGAACSILKVSCVSDDTLGTVSYTIESKWLTLLAPLYCVEAYVDPGATAPTDGFDVYVKTDAGFTVYSSTDCDTTVNTDLDRTKYKIITGLWTITAENCGNSKAFDVYLKFQ